MSAYVFSFVYLFMLPCPDNRALLDLPLIVCHAERDPPQHWHPKPDCLMIPNLGHFSVIDSL